MAMNEILAVPLPFTVVSNVAVNMPANLLNERLGRVAVFAHAGSRVIVDLGTPRSITVVALLATNANDSAKWRVRAANGIAQLDSGATYDSATRVVGDIAHGLNRIDRQAVILHPDPILARYWLIEYSDLFAGLDLEVGRLVLATGFTALDTMDIGYSFKVVDLGEARRSTSGLDNSTTRGKVLEFSWTWSWMSEPEARGDLLNILAYAGITRDILCILNPDAEDLHNVIGYGKLVEAVEGVNVAGGGVDSAYAATFRLQSRLILNL
jgi:hypothetical protein